MSLNSNVRSAFRAIRKNKGLTQEQLAFLAGISKHQYQSFEEGRRDLSLKAVERISEALSIELVPVPRDWRKEL